MGVLLAGLALVAGCSTNPSAGQNDLYTCGQVGYWDNYLLTGVQKATNADAEHIFSAAATAEDSQLREEGAQAQADWNANKINATATDFAQMTTICETFGLKVNNGSFEP